MSVATQCGLLRCQSVEQTKMYLNMGCMQICTRQVAGRQPLGGKPSFIQAGNNRSRMGVPGPVLCTTFTQESQGTQRCQHTFHSPPRLRRLIFKHAECTVALENPPESFCLPPPNKVWYELEREERPAPMIYMYKPQEEYSSTSQRGASAESDELQSPNLLCCNATMPTL